MSEFLKGSDHLTQAIAELKENPFSPELITNYWQVKLNAGGLEIPVPVCDWTEEEIKRPMKDIHGREVSPTMFYLPKDLTGKEGLARLGIMYPKIERYLLRKDTPMTDIHNTAGWGKGYTAFYGVNLNTTGKELEDFAKQQGYLYGRLRSYILVSKLSKDLTERYLDEGASSRLLGSFVGGCSVVASFDWDGILDVGYCLDSRVHTVLLGGWFEQAKKP